MHTISNIEFIYNILMKHVNIPFEQGLSRRSCTVELCVAGSTYENVFLRH